LIIAITNGLLINNCKIEGDGKKGDLRPRMENNITKGVLKHQVISLDFE
jgi:hypothetical protein